MANNKPAILAKLFSDGGLLHHETKIVQTKIPQSPSRHTIFSLINAQVLHLKKSNISKKHNKSDILLV